MQRGVCADIFVEKLFIKLNLFLIASDALICSKVSLELSWYRHLCVKNIQRTTVMIFFCYARQIGMADLYR